MKLRFLVLALVGLVWLPSIVGAQTPAAVTQEDIWQSGTLLAFNILWLIFAWICVRISAWLDRDLYEVGRRFDLSSRWHLGYTLSASVLFILLATLPAFLSGVVLLAVELPLLIVAILVPLIPYVNVRNKRVLEDMKILTPRHIRHSIANMFRRKKKPLEIKLPYEEGPPVVFHSEGPDPTANQVRIIAARNMPGYVPAKTLVSDAVDAQADRILIDVSTGGVRVQYDIDGVWQPGPAWEREPAEQILACFKTMGHANAEDRRSRQTAHFSFTYPDPKHKIPVEMVSQGTATGERALLKFDRGMKGLDSLERIGMRSSQQNLVSSYLKGEHGGCMVLVSAPPAGGFTTTFYAVLKSMDRLLRDFVAVEPVQDRIPYVENVEVTTYDPEKGETPDQILPKLILKQPDVYVLPHLVNAETIRLLCNEVIEEGRLVVAGVRAAGALEAVQQVLALGPRREELLQALKLVINVRLIRKLAETCKQPYAPSPQLLQQLGLPANRVRQLYREWQPNPEAPVDKKKLPPGACEVCGLVGPSCRGLLYRGRTGIFEILEIGDPLREVMSKSNNIEVWRQAARKLGFRTLREEGILLVAQGITSVTELQRVLQPSRTQSTSSGSARRGSQ
ncbi:MAG: hypothetical protein KatS3mg109_1664 [Pirellulaceae bacterium]|nr:MAG: hypothetical protein KatS3mg109_1664 [Pirellulaceae bacterium]